MELGGGIRTLEDIARYIEGGISRVILGSVALHNPALVREAVARYGDAVAVGIDAKDGMVRGSGWLEASDVHFVDLAKAMGEAGVRTIIYTDISKDGTLSGPSVTHYEQLIQACPDVKNAGLYGAICGKSLYEGTLSLEEALALAKEA